MGSQRLDIINIDKNTDYEKWVGFRDNGIGASETAAILGMSEWKCAHEVYYQKIGVFSQKRKENMAMAMGNMLEPIVADVYAYWDGDEDRMLENKRQGKRMRNLYEVKGYVVNPEFPHLFFSPDRLDLLDYDYGHRYIVRNNKLYTKHISRILEIKTVSGWAAKQWEDEFNPAYGIQLQTYLMGLGVDEGSIFTMKDGRNFSELILKRDDDICNHIHNVTKDFWERVTLGREAVAKSGDYEQFAPAPDGSRAYENFMKEKYKDHEEHTIHETNPELVSMAMESNRIALELSALEEKKRLCDNTLKTYMGSTSSVIDFGKYGKVTWRANVKGSRVFRNMVKPQ